MLESSLHGNDGPGWTPLMAAGVAFTAGTALGLAADLRWLWLGAALAALTAAAICAIRRRPERAAWIALLTLLLLAACHAATRTYYPPRDDVRHRLGSEAALATVTGRIEEIALSRPQRGAFAAFSYQAPTTGLLLDLRTIDQGAGPAPCQGKLLVRIREADHRVRPGALIKATGWISALEPPDNPGQRDSRARLASQGIFGRLTLPGRGNWRELEPAGAAPCFEQLRLIVMARADAALALGAQHPSTRLDFLRALLLGRYHPDLGPLTESFRDTGLTHLLSISGAHLGVLMLVLWVLVRLVCHRPAVIALIALGILGLYLLAIPPTVPVLRAAVMASLFCVAYATGRRVRGLDVLALAAILLLWWRPADLATPGFQLSFGIVAALLLWTRPLAVRLWPHGRNRDGSADSVDAAIALGADYVAANAVAFLAATPLVAYHFQIITPLAGIVSLLSLPFVAATLTLGYLKILLGALLPTVGTLLRLPLDLSADLMIALVERAAELPLSSIPLPGRPSLLWTAATLAAFLALVGRPRDPQRGRTLAAGGFCCLWLVLTCVPLPLQPAGPPITVNMLSVRDGSCYLIRCTDNAGWLPRTTSILFDCGSQSDLDVGNRTVVPVLARLGVRHLDAIVVSHADMDHFCGVLDVVDAVPTDRVLVPPQLIAEGRAEPRASVGFLLAGLAQRGIAVVPVSRGHLEQWAGSTARFLWPPPEYHADAANDSSLVLSLEHDGRRLLMTGDIQQEAITALLALEPDLHAQVTDLPHHGSFVRASPTFLEAVDPQIVLQSCHRRRLESDAWASMFGGPNQPERLVTARDGMVTVTFDQGHWQAVTFRSSPHRGQ